MLIFVTGAAGFIGRAVTAELINNGHQVLGLSRSDANTEIITKAGGTPHPGDLEDLESLKSGAKASDGIIHLAFIHDFANMAKSTAADRAAIEAMADAIAGTGKPLIIASGILGGPQGVTITEDTVKETSAFSDRELATHLVVKLSTEKQIRGMTMRLSPTVHDAGDWGFITQINNKARETGSAIYVDDGSARWSAVHRTDAAVLFRLAVEKGTAGAVYNAVAESSVPMKDIATLIGKRLQLPVESKSSAEAVQLLGFIGHAIALDAPATSEKTQKELGWTFTQPGLLADMEANYFS